LARFSSPNTAEYKNQIEKIVPALGEPQTLNWILSFFGRLEFRPPAETQEWNIHAAVERQSPKGSMNSKYEMLSWARPYSRFPPMSSAKSLVH